MIPIPALPRRGRQVSQVEAAWNEAWVGGEQTRLIRSRAIGCSSKVAHAAPEPEQPGGPRLVIWDREKLRAALS